MLGYYVKSFQNMFDFKGRASRAEYWWAYLCHLIVYFVLELLLRQNANIIVTLYSLVRGVAMLSLGIRRMHDVGKSGWFLLIPFVDLYYLVKAGKEDGTDKSGSAEGVAGRSGGYTGGTVDIGRNDEDAGKKGGNALVTGNPAGSGSVHNLVCLSGYFSGGSFPLESNEALIFGRDPKKCNVVYDSRAKGLSRVHCRVDVSEGRIVLTDLGSTYGTFLQNAQRIAANQSCILRPGDRFYLASQGNMFQVR